MLYYVEDTPGAWSDSTKIQSVLIDDECGTAFEANGYDLNTDGNDTHQKYTCGRKASLMFAYHFLFLRKTRNCGHLHKRRCGKSVCLFDAAGLSSTQMGKKNSSLRLQAFVNPQSQ